MIQLLHPGEVKSLVLICKRLLGALWDLLGAGKKICSVIPVLTTCIQARVFIPAPCASSFAAVFFPRALYIFPIAFFFWSAGLFFPCCKVLRSLSSSCFLLLPFCQPHLLSPCWLSDLLCIFSAGCSQAHFDLSGLVKTC